MKKLISLLIVLILLALPGLASQTNSGQTPEELLALWYQVGALLRESGSYPYVELRIGDSGYEVLALQTRLKELNYYEKEVVPIFGGGTEGALRHFERVNGLKVNGWASVEDQQLLFKSIALPNAGTTVQPSPSSSPPANSLVPNVTVKPITSTPTASVTGSGATSKPPTPTPATTLGEPVSAPPVTPTPGLTLGPIVTFKLPTSLTTLGPQVTYKLPTTKIATPGPFVTLVLPIVTPPPFDLTKPELVIPHP